jgi:hypothetical protein
LDEAQLSTQKAPLAGGAEVHANVIVDPGTLQDPSAAHDATQIGELPGHTV